MGEELGFGIGDSGFGEAVLHSSRPHAPCLLDCEGTEPKAVSADRRAAGVTHAPPFDAARTHPESRIANPGARWRARGFTLLEVLIALLILSLALVALIRAAGLQAQALNHHRDSTLAQWVAANVAAELRAQGAPPVGRQQGEMRMGPQRWRWQAETSDTDVERVRRMEITVFAADSGSLAGSDADPVARLTAFATP